MGGVTDHAQAPTPELTAVMHDDSALGSPCVAAAKQPHPSINQCFRHHRAVNWEYLMQKIIFIRTGVICQYLTEGVARDEFCA